MSNLEHITLEIDKVPLGDDKTLENNSKHSYGGAIDGRTRNALPVPRAVPETDDDDNDDRPFVKDGSDNPGGDDGLFSTGGGHGSNGHGNVNVPDGGRRPPFSFPGYNGPGFVTINGIAVGVGLILNGRYNIKNGHDICRANRINNYTVIGIFIVTVVNVLITAFTVDRDDIATAAALRANTT
ncbi:GM24800 [Drosophila sechellia]|uniref:GM24800 n=1 Tax=Drosophila sechellia TaxID=7238 RepID=B4HDR4_DROSE|nr:GM24800 [Drosophila sechellia]